MKDSFVFYRSFYEAINDLPIENQVNLYKAICELSLNDNNLELQGIENTIFKLIKPQIQANNDRYENGKKGGRPKKNSEEKNHRLSKIKTIGYENKKPNVNDNVNENDNVNVNDNVNYYELKIGILNSNILEQIENYEKDVDGKQKIKLAIDKAVESNARNFNYIKAILQSWYGKEIKDILLEEEKFKNKKKKNSPEWFNQEIKKEEITKDEQKELDDLLKEFQ